MTDIFNGVVSADKRSHSRRIVDILIKLVRPAIKTIIARSIRNLGVKKCRLSLVVSMYVVSHKGGNRT